MCLDNLQQFVDIHSLPILPHLLSLPAVRHNFAAPVSAVRVSSSEAADKIRTATEAAIEKHKLNEFQSAALRKIANLFQSDSNPVTLVHGKVLELRISI